MSLIWLRYIYIFHWKVDKERCIFPVAHQRTTYKEQLAPYLFSFIDFCIVLDNIFLRLFPILIIFIQSNFKWLWCKWLFLYELRILRVAKSESKTMVAITFLHCSKMKSVSRGIAKLIKRIFSYIFAIWPVSYHLTTQWWNSVTCIRYIHW